MKSSYESLPPKFALYGEMAGNPDPGYVHIEDIASRSKRLDWKIRPHRHTSLFQLLHIQDGDMQLQLDSEQAELYAPCSVTIPVGSIHGFQFRPNTSGKVLSVATSLLESPGYSKLFNDLGQRPVIYAWHDQPEALKRLTLQLGELQSELDEAQPGFEAAMEWQVGKILLALTRAIQKAANQQKEVTKTSASAERFRQLVEENFSRNWKISDYAQQLHLSVSSLHRHCLSGFGVTPKQLLHNRQVREAKRRLVYTQNPVEHIAYELGFKDPAYFSRFFQREVGLPPAGYRKQYSRRN